MPVRINLHRNAVEARVSGVFQSALPQLSEEILNDCNQYCKEDTGMLIASSYIHSQLDDGKLIWQTPYARRQYWEIRTAIPDPNPNATWKWCEAAKKARLPIWEKQAQRLLEMNL
jgi:hypothetical protein